MPEARIIPVVLSGGSGTRLWPVSREKHPKQLQPLLGDASLLQDTLRRLDGLPLGAPVVVSNQKYRFITAEQLRQLGLDSWTLLLEPLGRNTAPALTAAALYASRDGADPVLLATPADHHVRDAGAFRAAVMRGLADAEAGAVVTFGIVPDRPETGYGYIETKVGQPSPLIPLPEGEGRQSASFSFQEKGGGMRRDTAFEKELLAQIDAETWRARRIVRSLLDYARDRPFSRETVPLAPLVEESLRLVRGQIPAQVSLNVAVPAELNLSGDKQRLQQAIFNLVGNALDALEGAGELHVVARPARGAYPPDTLVFGQVDDKRPQIEVEVRDNGHGIAADILPRIFDPFFTTKEVGHGLGLGLFIVFEIVEEHGGSIAVKSTPGQGTTFLIRLPAQETAT